jgi:thioesterase domain-containing protein
MKVLDFLTMLRDQDIQVWADGERLRCSAPAGALRPELRDELRQRKDDILNFLRSAGSLARQPRAIVPLQSRGTRTPVFAVAGHNGDVFCFRALAQHLGNDQPFYGLEPPGRDGQSEPLTTVEDLAAYFAKQIRAFRPTGPYIIAGYCAGGTIAFELGRRLLREGAEIPFLALFGAPYPTSYRALPQLQQRLRRQAERVVRFARDLATQSSTERRLYIAEKLHNLKTQRAVQDTAAPDAVLLWRAKVEHATFAATRTHTPGYFAGRVCLLLPCKQWVRSGNQPLRWRSVAQHTEEYFGPDDCTGDSMLRQPHASEFAELFKQCRARNEPTRIQDLTDVCRQSKIFISK